MKRSTLLAFDIGCIECGEDSNVIGVYDTEGEAVAACAEWETVGWRGGQHYYEVFDLNTAAVGLPKPAESSCANPSCSSPANLPDTLCVRCTAVARDAERDAAAELTP